MSKRIHQQKEGMVDTSHKETTRRVARASAEIKMSQSGFKAFLSGASPKGDVLETAKVAGIMAAKSTFQIIPMCHPLELSKIKMTHEINRTKRTIVLLSEVVYCGKTGVEMEALTAVCVAALTVYDMMKWVDKSMIIGEVKLLHKEGGKSGDYHGT